MTNEERLISLVGFSPGVNVIEGALVDAGISGTDTYETTNLLLLKTLARDMLLVLLTTPDTTNENGYAIKYDRGAVYRRWQLLDDEINGIARPVISAVHPW